MNKKPLIAGALVLVAAAAFAAWYLHRQPADASQLVLYGNVDLRQVSLAFNGSERIARLEVQEGDRVKAGQVLGQLDTRSLELQAAQAEAQIAGQAQALQRLKAGSRPEEVAQSRAQVAAAQADAELARQQLERLQGIRQTTAGRAVSQQDLDAAQARRKVAEAQLENTRKAQQLVVAGPRKEDIAQAQAQLDVATAALAVLRHQLQEARLVAPIDAVVRARLLEPGDMASPQRPVFTLAITDPKWVRAYVTESDLGRIRPGMAATLSTDSHPGEPLAGKVGYISSVAEFTPKTVQTEQLRSSLVYEIRVLADDPADRLRLGMPVTVRLALDGDARIAGSAR
ncbi:HlyD family efflux transporter periplasmic adaptor subunit [Variovorax saccharolyticus]|uniref:HlyD family efflux transporter periplasmic adaptor subunit n=1 Tax=Variovorax saccharolyticus TaxID=3053516 RepID=UPI0025776DD3|nr:HlyD family efflux transporter periplasmic adaptor subunit [Variovorax sp. J22R187]MDM0018889.1 HlyD family efflux transporter periplasmic adaptor subunit [Variovorax sp. J22R187]